MWALYEQKQVEFAVLVCSSRQPSRLSLSPAMQPRLFYALICHDVCRAERHDLQYAFCRQTHAGDAGTAARLPARLLGAAVPAHTAGGILLDEASQARLLWYWTHTSRTSTEQSQQLPGSCCREERAVPCDAAWCSPVQNECRPVQA